MKREVLCKQPGFDKMCKLIDIDTYTRMSGTGFSSYGNSTLYEILIRFGDFDTVMDFIKAARPTFIYTDEFRNLVKHYTKEKIDEQEKSIFVLGKYKYEIDDKNEYTYYNNKFHSYGDKPAIRLSYAKYWYKNGKKHRRDGPASIQSFLEGTEEKEEWFINGEPAAPEPGLSYSKRYNYYLGKKYVSAEFFPDKPNKISEIFWYEPLNGKSYKHREIWRNGRENDLPTIIEYYTNGKISEEKWVKNKKWHRDSGKPSHISYDRRGNITNKKYFVNGREIKK